MNPATKYIKFQSHIFIFPSNFDMSLSAVRRTAQKYPATRAGILEVERAGSCWRGWGRTYPNLLVESAGGQLKLSVSTPDARHASRRTVPVVSNRTGGARRYLAGGRQAHDSTVHRATDLSASPSQYLVHFPGHDVIVQAESNNALLAKTENLAHEAERARILS